MRILALLLILHSFTILKAADQGNGQVPLAEKARSILEVLESFKGDPNQQRRKHLAACLKTAQSTAWSEIQVHFYCWLLPEQRACFTAAADGKLPRNAQLKGELFDSYYACKQLKGNALGFDFNQPFANFSTLQQDIFLELMARGILPSQDEQTAILRAFYKGNIPSSETIEAELSKNTDAAAQSSQSSGLGATPATLDLCRIKSSRVRLREQPTARSQLKATIDRDKIKLIEGPLEDQGSRNHRWYRVEAPINGISTGGFISASVVTCEAT